MSRPTYDDLEREVRWQQQKLTAQDTANAELRGELLAAEASLIACESRANAAESGAERLAESANRWMSKAESLKGELEYAIGRLSTLERRVARARDICQHANRDWLDDEELPIRPEQVLAELEEMPVFLSADRVEREQSE